MAGCAVQKCNTAQIQATYLPKDGWNRMQAVLVMAIINGN